MKSKLSKKNKKIVLFSCLGVCFAIGIAISAVGGSYYMNYSRFDKINTYYDKAYQRLEDSVSNSTELQNFQNISVAVLIHEYNSLGVTTFKSEYLTKLNDFQSYGNTAISDNATLTTFNNYLNVATTSLNNVDSYFPTTSIFTIGLIFLMAPLGIGAILFFTRNVSKKQMQKEQEKLKAISRQLQPNV